MVRHNFLITLLFTVITPFVLWGATTGKITGKVMDQETALPLPGANIVIVGTSYGSAAGGDGFYIITNVSPGTYSLAISMIGYKVVTVQNVRVNADLTTTQNFNLVTAVIEGESITVEAVRPLIQQDITASRTIQSGADVLAMPVDNYTQALTTIAGAVYEGGELHFRGGRAQEIAYLLDNTAMTDPLSGNNDSRITSFAIEETHTMTGGFSAEYGNAQSGVVNVVTKDGGDKFSSKVRYTTSDFGISSGLSTINDDEYGIADEVAENLNRVELSLSGPMPILSSLLPGTLNYLLTADFQNTQGRFVNNSAKNTTILGKITYRPVPQFTVRFNWLLDDGLRRRFRGALDGIGVTSSQNTNLWKVSTDEDRYFDGMAGLEHWIGNGNLDSEDIGIDNGTGNIIGAGNGRIDWIDVNGSGEWEEGEPTEDLNKNARYDGTDRPDREDLDRNGQLDVHSMLDHLSGLKTTSGQTGLSLTHQLSERTFYEIKFTRYQTRAFINANEKINEDIDGDGKIDLVDEWIQTSSGDYQWVDLDGDGYFDRGDEDLNGNELLDEYGADLFRDENDNEYVDASEIGPAPRDYFVLMGLNDPESTWMPWSDIDYKGEKNSDGYYVYGSGKTWDRRSWYLDNSVVYGLKFDIDSQISESQRIRSGFDLNLKNIFRHDGTDRYGYGEIFKVNPTQFAIYIQDKMEYSGMILNIGLRYDYFNANWNNYPRNLKDPTWDREEIIFSGNEDANSNGLLDPGEDLNGNGFLDQDWIAEKYAADIDGDGVQDLDEDGFPVYTVYPGGIKDPSVVASQDFISPRFGISYPITDNDKMYFSYGRYFSAPLGTSLYRNLEFDLGGGFPVIGNPSLEPEKTSSYEAGVIHAFRNQSTLELKGFFKNITGLTNSKAVYMNQRDWFAFYINSDYGSVRGFELTYTQRAYAIGPFQVSGMTTYTFQIAKNKGSDPFEGYLREWANWIQPTEETYTAWDQRHTLNVNFDIRTSNQLGFLLGGWSLNTLYNYGSGARWSPPKGQDRAALDNTRMMPEKHTVDLRMGKTLLSRGVEVDFILDVRNLFDQRNVIAIADEEWYALFDGDDEDNLPDHDPQGKFDDPTVYSRGRLVRAGLQFNF